MVLIVGVCWVPGRLAASDLKAPLHVDPCPGSSTVPITASLEQVGRASGESLQRRGTGPCRRNQRTYQESSWWRN